MRPSVLTVFAAIALAGLLAWAQAPARAQATGPSAEARLAFLEAEIDALRAKLRELEARLGPARAASTIDIPRGPLVVTNLPVVGQATASVVVVEFGDFQCPYCRRFAIDSFPSIKKEFIDTGLIRYRYGQLPLTRIHPGAQAAAEAAVCASRVGQFWPMHDVLLQADRFDRKSLLSIAARTKMDVAIFDRCLNGDARAEVAAQSTLVSELGVTSTPAFFVGLQEEGGVRVLSTIKGAQPLAAFRDAIRAALRAAEKVK